MSGLPCATCLSKAKAMTTGETCCIYDFIYRARQDAEVRYRKASNELTAEQDRSAEVKTELAELKKQTENRKQKLEELQAENEALRAKMAQMEEQLRKKCIDKAADEALQAIHDMDVTDHHRVDTRSPCMLVYTDRAAKKIRSKAQEDVYMEFAGKYVFGEFRWESNYTIKEVVERVQAFLEKNPSMEVHVIVLAGAKDLQNNAEADHVLGWDELAHEMVQQMETLVMKNPRVRSLTWFSMPQHPEAQTVAGVNEKVLRLLSRDDSLVGGKDMRSLTLSEGFLNEKDIQPIQRISYSNKGCSAIMRRIKQLTKECLNLTQADMVTIEAERNIMLKFNEQRAEAARNRKEEIKKRKQLLAEIVHSRASSSTGPGTAKGQTGARCKKNEETSRNHVLEQGLAGGNSDFSLSDSSEEDESWQKKTPEQKSDKITETRKRHRIDFETSLNSSGSSRATSRPPLKGRRLHNTHSPQAEEQRNRGSGHDERHPRFRLPRSNSRQRRETRDASRGDQWMERNLGGTGRNRFDSFGPPRGEFSGHRGQSRDGRWNYQPPRGGSSWRR